ncbi:hypothetical protein R1flu_017905 [Riccia fluitans]|uniref:Uncharacterized protein n=1 Tax=Riccia fluitans TaxID=41844 RepID=A0ABD1ZFC1_9MARC
MITEDYDAIMTYIENPEYYRDITGVGKKTRIGGSTISKFRAFDIMAFALSEINGFPQVTGEEMKKHFVRYEKMYKDTYRWKDSTGAGLTDVEIQKGLTMEEKLNKLCPHFRRMDVLYDKRPNIMPCAEESAGLPLDVDMEYVSKDSQIAPWSNKDTMDEYIILGSGESDAEEEVHVTRVTTGVEEKFVAEDHAKETFINLVDVEYGEDETFRDEEGKHFEHASGGRSEVNEPIRLQKGIPRSISRIAHAKSGMSWKENVAEGSNASGFYRCSKDIRSQVMVLY